MKTADVAAWLVLGAIVGALVAYRDVIGTAYKNRALIGDASGVASALAGVLK